MSTETAPVDARRGWLRTFLAAVALSALAAALMPAATSAGGPGLNLQPVQQGFTNPIFMTHAGDSRLFVVEQTGDIHIVGITKFLDISHKISAGGERGLLGLAFHPNYGSNGLFYVFYTRASDGDLVIAEYSRSGNPDVADPNSERILLIIEHSSAGNHNGGWIDFWGQNLYIATGDGGGGGDPERDAPNINSLLGKILRINPLDPDGAGPKRYSIPAKNPYVGRAGLDEIFARGLRNPWRCSHDPLNGKFWCNDVGQGLYEEINRVKTGRGVNFGWPKLECRHLYPSGSLCTSGCKTMPIAEYSHSFNQSTGAPCTSTTGGYVSRRSGAALYGKYVSGDFCSGFVWIIPADFVAGNAPPSPIDTPYSISSFGRDNSGRLYLLDHGGTLYRLLDS